MGRPFAWEGSYPDGLRWDAPIALSTVPALLDRAVSRFGERDALDFRGRKIGYARLGREAARIGAALVA